LYNKFQKEYNDLKNTINKSIKDDKEFSKKEIAKIKLELSDIIELADNESI